MFSKREVEETRTEQRKPAYNFTARPTNNQPSQRLCGWVHFEHHPENWQARLYVRRHKIHSL
uniref:Uncharacterized protein n=1 Tax=Arundo donax TaxID=35708 RepID=A0A0A9CAJ3_ARUDO